MPSRDLASVHANGPSRPKPWGQKRRREEKYLQLTDRISTLDEPYPSHWLEREGDLIHTFRLLRSRN